MKSATAPLIAFINAQNVFRVADLYDIYLANGDNLRWTDADRPVEYPTTGTVILDLAGAPAPGVFSPDVGISRGGVRWTSAPEVQSLDVTLMVTETEVYNGAPIAQRLLEGLFDGARVRLYRAFFANDGTLVDVLFHFEGTVGDVEPTSSSVRLTVKSELDKLNIKLPRNLFTPGCAHAFLDQGCDPNPPGTLRATVTATGALVGTPTKYVVAVSGTAASNYYQLGVILMTSGAASGTTTSSPQLREWWGRACTHALGPIHNRPSRRRHLLDHARVSSHEGGVLGLWEPCSLPWLPVRAETGGCISMSSVARQFESEEQERANVCEIARTWLGTPYHHRARLKGIGVDCGQLIAAVFEEAGLIPPVPLEFYPPDWMLHRDEPRFQNTVERYCKQVEREIRPADILLFRVGRSFAHGAIVLEYPMIIHAHARQSVVILSSMEQESVLRDRLAGVWTFRDWT